MAKATLYNTKGEKIKEVTLSAALFGSEIKAGLIAQAVHVQTHNQHQGTSRAKTRGEVDRTKTKWFRQKGTGKARHGARSAPIFVGGGVAHGPKGLVPTAKKLNQKMRRQAMISALSLKASQDSIALLADLSVLSAKTRDLSTLLTAIAPVQKKILLITNDRYSNLVKAGTNIKFLTLASADNLNMYQVLKAKTLIFEEAAVTALEDRFASTKKVETKLSEPKAAPKVTKSTSKTAVTPTAPKKVVKKVTAKK